MKFKDIYPYFVAGASIKREGWSGFWRYDLQGIRMYLKDGDIINFEDSPNMISTLSHMVIDDWHFATKDNCSIEAGEYI